ncbi:MAG TPA: hypothetical protein PK413_16100 [Thermoanaerobaculia bacterium]|nr:hypothetical protein [Thermoanaerobaculia bacterium]
MRRLSAYLLLLPALFATGCFSQLGPRTVPKARFNYAEALVHSANEQLLANLVRLRYRDNPVFLDIGSVVTHFDWEAGASASASWNGGKPGDRGVGISGSYAEQPTVTYSPLQGNDFVARLLAPISPANLVLLSQSGWSIERLMLCCVQKVNEVRNAMPAAGPTPDFAPSYQDFHHLAQLLRRLQVAGVLEVEVGEKQELVLHLERAPEGPLGDDAREVRDLLGLPRERAFFRISSSLMQHDSDEIAVAGRSLLSVLFYLSQAVEVPPEDEEAGRVTVTQNPDGSRFDWLAATGGLLRVHAAEKEPSDAAVAVAYRGHWFYIADNDLNSKTTFSLLAYLFQLKAGNQEVKEPVLTLGVR